MVNLNHRLGAALNKVASPTLSVRGFAAPSTGSHDMTAPFDRLSCGCRLAPALLI